MAIGFPTVPQGKARIRVMNSATHSKADLDQALVFLLKSARTRRDPIKRGVEGRIDCATPLS